MSDIDVLAVYPGRRHLSAKVRVMIDFLAEAFKGTAEWGRERKRKDLESALVSALLKLIGGRAK